MVETHANYAPNITIIGGGTGTATLYPEIARLTPNATALVSMSDSGGSSGRLMQEFDGLGPLGDLSQVITAASENEAVRAMLGLRFPGNGSLAGHTPRNMALAGFVLEHGLDEGVAFFSQAMQARGTILPITLDSNRLVMEDGPGNLIHDEHVIDKYTTRHAEPKVWLEPEAKINPKAEEAIAASELIVLASGSPYTSQLAALSVHGVREALEASRAPKVMIANLMNEPHDTPGWHVADYVQLLVRHGVAIDYVVYNTAIPTPVMQLSYEQEGKRPVDCRPEGFARTPTIKAIGARLLSTELENRVRHDAKAIVMHLGQILSAQPAEYAPSKV